VWPENIPAVSAFLRIQGQWRTYALGDGRLRFLGLDYGAARIGFELAGVEIAPDIWSEIQIVEAAACAALNGERH